MDATKDSIQVLIQNHEIRLIGVLSFETSPSALNLVENYLKGVGKENQKKIVLNLSEITRSDSSGLTVLSGMMREAKKRNLKLTIKDIPEKLFNLAKLSGLDSILLFDA